MSVKAILIVGVCLVAIFFLLLYYVLSGHTEDISNKEPYKSVIGKKLTLKQDAVIIKNLPAFSKFSNNLLTNKEEPLFDGTSVLYQIPKGTELSLIGFKSVTNNGPSKYWQGYGTGKVFIKELQAEIDFEYQWGGTTFTYTTDDQVVFKFSTPLWEPCPFNDDIKGQSMEQVKDFENATWDSVAQKAIVLLSPSETLVLSTGGCLRFETNVSYKTTARVALDSHQFWNEKINWIFERVFKSESKRFINALKNKTLIYEPSGSDDSRRIYLFDNNEYNTNNVVISFDGKYTVLEINWYETEKERMLN